jgi:DNA-binding IclR family transcriptional regulator
MVEDEWLKPGAISSMTGINKNTVYPTVRDLADEGIVRNSDEGAYMIPSVNVEQACDYLEGDD